MKTHGTSAQSMALPRRFRLVLLLLLAMAIGAAADKVAARASEDEMRECRSIMLDGVAAPEKSNGARDKTVTVLSHIWFQDPDLSKSLPSRWVQLLLDAHPHRWLAKIRGGTATLKQMSLY